MTKQTKLMFKEIAGSLVLFACFLAMAAATMVVLGSCGGDDNPTGPREGSVYQYYHTGSMNPFYQVRTQPDVEGDPEPPITVSSATDISGYYTEEEFRDLGIEIVGGGGRNPWGNCPAGTYVGLHCGLNGIGMWSCYWSSECTGFSGID